MKFKFISLIVTMFLFVMVSCRDDFDEHSNPDLQVENSMAESLANSSISNPIVLGEKLVNPYSLDVMRKALNELNSLKKSSISEIKATHLYVRFKPQDEAEFNEIAWDNTILYYPFPLDYEIVEDGDFYQDPSIEDGKPTFQYCVFKIGQKIPNVEYEVLDSCYILEETNVVEEEGVELSKSFEVVNGDWKQLEKIALGIAEIEDSPMSISKNWLPTCTLRYYDDSKRAVVPIEGVQVRCRNNLMISTQRCTDSEGYAKFDHKSGKVDYFIHWQRDKFKVRPNTGLNEAVTTLKKNTKSRIDVTFYKNSSDWPNEWKYAHVFRPAYTYVYGNIDGLSRPAANLTLRVKDWEDYRDAGGCSPRDNGSHSDIHIYNLNSHSSDFIYGTVIHEIAHYSHRTGLLQSDYLFSLVNSALIEGWAVGVENYLTSKSYPGYRFFKFYDPGAPYSEIVTNMIEGSDRNYIKVTNQVYTITEIERTLKTARSWTEWRNNVKSYYPLKNNEKYIDKLFADWDR